jgi:hypothetical protein
VPTNFALLTASDQGVKRDRMPTLPRGLDPVSAGRFGLWLLSRRSHRAKQRRVAFPARVWPQTLVWRWVRLISPWRCHEYPGAAVVISSLCEIAPSYAWNLLKPSWASKLPPRHAHRLAAYLEAHAAESEALARELRAYAQDRTTAKNG